MYTLKSKKVKMNWEEGWRKGGGDVNKPISRQHTDGFSNVTILFKTLRSNSLFMWITKLEKRSVVCCQISMLRCFSYSYSLPSACYQIILALGMAAFTAVKSKCLR